jgi:hypothetical protein
VGKPTHQSKGNVMKKYKIRVETPGKLLAFKNRKIRTPFTIEIYERDLELFKSTMISADINEFHFENLEKSDKIDDEWESIILDKDEDVVIEDLYEDDEEEPSTLLGKLLKNEKKNGE